MSLLKWDGGISISTRGYNYLVGTKPSATPERAIELQAPFRGAPAPHVCAGSERYTYSWRRALPTYMTTMTSHPCGLMESRLGNHTVFAMTPEGWRSTHNVPLIPRNCHHGTLITFEAAPMFPSPTTPSLKYSVSPLLTCYFSSQHSLTLTGFSMPELTSTDLRSDPPFEIQA